MAAPTIAAPAPTPLISAYPRRGVDENLRLQAQARPTHPALIFYGSTVTYSDLWRDVQALAGFLAARFGIGPGSRVALDLQNSPQYVTAYYAVLRAGAAVVPLNPMYRAEEVSKILNDAGVTTAIVADDLLDRFSGWDGSEALRIIVARYAEALPEVPAVTPPALFHAPAPDLSADPRLIAWSEALAQPREMPALNTAESPCVMPYTSGSTGMPKGCPHTHASVMHTAAAQAEWYRFTPQSVVSAVQPLFHVAGMQGSMNAALYAGATLLLMTRWDAQAALALFARYGLTFFNAPPTMVVDLLSQDNFDERALEKVEIITGGGASMPVAVAGELKRRFGLVYVEGYGMSETMSPTHLNPLEDARAGSIGVPIQQTISLIADPETLAPLPDGEIGEILVAGPQVISGYWNNPQADAESFAVVDGRRMLRTGDLGYRDADGHFHIVDRLKRMINASGFKVWPTEVEAVLFEHEAVRQCCVIAAPDSYRGETVKAVIIAKPAFRDRVTADDIIAFARTRLAAFKVPRQVEFVDEMPLTASHKIDWRAVQAANAARTANGT